MSDLIGVENLIPNPSPDGGDLHQTTTGGFLNVHPHYSLHPYLSSWQRRVNLLLYLNEDWTAENGGDLELWNPDVVRWVEKITPDTNSDQSAGKVLAFGDSYFQRLRSGS